jgi:hypothetical protein
VISTIPLFLPLYSCLAPYFLSDDMYRNLPLIEEMNPVVFGCIRDVMRYAAFFRYCKEENPVNFKEIEDTIRRIHITPNIETPNGIQ